jgi:hypothetical protein
VETANEQEGRKKKRWQRRRGSGCPEPEAAGKYQVINSEKTVINWFVPKLVQKPCNSEQGASGRAAIQIQETVCMGGVMRRRRTTTTTTTTMGEKLNGVEMNGKQQAGGPR